MTDPEIIDGAYADLVKNIASSFFNAYLTAASDQDRTDAQNKFISAIRGARQATVVAKKILP